MVSRQLTQAKTNVFADPSHSFLTMVLLFLSVFVSSFAVATPSSVASSVEKTTPPPHLADQGHHYLTKFEYFVDTENNLTIEKFLDPTLTIKSELVDGQQPNLGQIDHPVWFHFRIKNVESTDQTFVLQVHFSLIDHLELYRVQTNGPVQAFTKELAGDTISSNQHKRSSFLFEADIAAGATADFYLRAETQSSMWLPISIASQEAYKNYPQQSSIFNGVFYGIIIGLLCFNLFIYFSVREASYLYYIALMSANLLFWLTVDGLAFEYLWPGQVQWQQLAPHILVYALIALSVQFCRIYLRIAESEQAVSQLLFNLVWISIVASIAALVMPISMSNQLSLGLAVVSSVFLLWCSYIRWRRGYRPALYFMCAWGIYLVSVTVGILSMTSMINATHHILETIKIASALEMIFFSLGLADYINTLKDEQLQSQSDALQAALENKAKTEFLAKMSHEIRTPMNGVLGMAEILQSTELDNRQKHYVDVINHSGQALLSVINDILDHSRIEAGKLELENIPFNLEHLVDECISIFSIKANEKGISLLSSVRPGTPTLLKGDPTRLKQVIINLLSNAIKFTDKGEILLAASSTNNSRREEPQIRFEVQDTGIGITEDNLEQVFKSYNCEDSIARQFGGTGLGLSLCKQLVHLMRGEIGVESEVKVGSHFWFTATFTIATDAEVSPVIRAAELKGIKLLVVDDHTTLFRNIQEKATSWGMTVDTALNGRQALRKLEKSHDLEEPFHILLTDWSMPEMNGLELCETIRKDNRNNRLDIILMSSSRVMPEKEILAKLHISSTLEKPFTSDQLHDALGKIVGARPIEPRKVLQTPDQSFDHLKVLVAEDNQVNQMVIRGILKKLNIIPDFANDGMEAIEVYKEEKGEYDLILMDCDMPEMDGFEATSKIRALQVKKKNRPLLIFALSAHVLEEYKIKAIQVGMDDFIAKPVELAAIQKKLSEWSNHLPAAEPLKAGNE